MPEKFRRKRRNPSSFLFNSFRANGFDSAAAAGVKVSTIRTALMKAGKAYVQAGGGWVNDSVPEKEYEETVNKAKSMFQTIALAQTISNEERG